MAKDEPQTNIRPIMVHPIGTDGLFIQPDTRKWDDKRKAKYELEEAHNRERFANKFDYADPWTGNTRTYDPDGRYNCGTCNQHEETECELLGDQVTLDLEAASCAKYEDESGGDPELDFGPKGVASPEDVGYGVSANGKGFGCHRCPFMNQAFEPDSQGRSGFCGKGRFRVLQTACCALNGAKLKAAKKGKPDEDDGLGLSGSKDDQKERRLKAAKSILAR